MNKLMKENVLLDLVHSLRTSICELETY